MFAEQIANKIHTTNTNEIKMGLLAKEKGNSPAVRYYGTTLIEDHTASDKKLSRVASRSNIKQ